MLLSSNKHDVGSYNVLFRNLRGQLGGCSHKRWAGDGEVNHGARQGFKLLYFRFKWQIRWRKWVDCWSLEFILLTVVFSLRTGINEFQSSGIIWSSTTTEAPQHRFGWTVNWFYMKYIGTQRIELQLSFKFSCLCGEKKCWKGSLFFCIYYRLDPLTCNMQAGL